MSSTLEPGGSQSCSLHGRVVGCSQSREGIPPTSRVEALLEEATAAVVVPLGNVTKHARVPVEEWVEESNHRNRDDIIE
jgi:hypothetical protein